MNSSLIDGKIDEYIDTLPTWQQTIARQVWALVHQAEPAIQETIKRKIYPYFVYDGNVCAIVGAKDHLNIFIYDPIAPDPAGLINQGHGNKTARAIQIYETDSLNEAAFIDLIRAVVANNRAGGWRKLI